MGRFPVFKSTLWPFISPCQFFKLSRSIQSASSVHVSSLWVIYLHILEPYQSSLPWHCPWEWGNYILLLDHHFLRLTSPFCYPRFNLKKQISAFVTFNILISSFPARLEWPALTVNSHPALPCTINTNKVVHHLQRDIPHWQLFFCFRSVSHLV